MRINSLLDARKASLAAATFLAVTTGVAGVAAAVPLDSSALAASGLGASASVANDTLAITGSNEPDRIAVALADGDVNKLIVDLDGDGLSDESFDRTTFSRITVVLRGSDDVFAEVGPLLPDEAVTVDAGNGNDDIVTGPGNDAVFGGHGNDAVRSGGGDDRIDAASGDDLVFGELGRDSASLGSGRDVFVWNPGDASDDVEGNGSTDTLVFNGSSASEVMSLSANGRRSVFLREPGQITMNMGGVEQLALAALGGSDSVTINDMRGTHFRAANIDLSVAGNGDGQVDNVTVNGTERADHVRARAGSGTVDVVGLDTATRISGSDPIDQLKVNSLGGNDKVNIEAGVFSLLGVVVDLGAGQL
jgi:hypothetical protein